MKVYYHKTDGGAEYLSVSEGNKFFEGVFARVDGGEMEIYFEQLQKLGYEIIIKNR